MVVDALDVADLVSERAHAYVMPNPGWSEMKVLADPLDGQADMFDSGRRTELHQVETYRLKAKHAGERAHLVMRTTPEQHLEFEVRVSGKTIAHANHMRVEGWQENVFDLDESATRSGTIDVTIYNIGPGDFIDYHVWLTQKD